MSRSIVGTVLVVALTLLIQSCGALPKLSLTPVSVQAKMGGQHETATDEDSVVKVQTGDSNNTSYKTDRVDQVYNNVQEYPTWLIIAFAVAFGFALPSPISWYNNRRRCGRLNAEIDHLRTEMKEVDWRRDAP